MTEKQFVFGNKKLCLTPWAENAVRFRLSADFKETYLERYGILTPAVDGCGTEIENGVRAGGLSVRFEGGVITFDTGKCRREIDLCNDGLAEMLAYFMERTGSFRPEPRQIIGDENYDKIVHVDFVKNPVYMTLKTEGEKFYGLGESNVDRLILNGKTYLNRVVYTQNEIPIPFIMTKAGYGIVNLNTIWHGVDVCAKNGNEVTVLQPDGDLDFIIFAGNTLRDILERFTFVTGRAEVLPKWAYGLMFIEQYNADQFEVMRDAATFREKRIPVDSFSLEPGWMAGGHYDFSTTKKWNTDRFYICDWMRKTPENYADLVPRDGNFTSALHRYGYKLMLWLCCRHDFTANQENRAGNSTDFGIEPWFKHLKTFVCDGANGFKMDPCKVVDTAGEDRVYANGQPEWEMHSLQNTLYGKEMYEGFSEYTGLRPMHHMSGGYTGSQRFAAATTGDSGGRHKTMVWILNSGLSGITNITCDMDIFAAHTIHYCFFTAWCELDSWSGYSHPWWAGEENEKLFTFYDRLRYHLLPYIYSAAIDAHLTGIPVARALPLMFDEEKVENETCEMMFGDFYLVGSFSDTIYLPEGHKWIDAWSGKVFEGGQTLPIDVPEGRGGPLYIKGGAIVPTQKDKEYTDCRDDAHLTLEIYPVEGARENYVLHEDDGRTLKYLDGERANTAFTLTCENKKAVLTIGRRTGAFDGMNAGRTYGVKAFAPVKPAFVKLDGKETEFIWEDGFACFEAGEAETVEIRY